MRPRFHNLPHTPRNCHISAMHKHSAISACHVTRIFNTSPRVTYPPIRLPIRTSLYGNWVCPEIVSCPSTSNHSISVTLFGNPLDPPDLYDNSKHPASIMSFSF